MSYYKTADSLTKLVKEYTLKSCLLNFFFFFLGARISGTYVLFLKLLLTDS